MNVMLTVLVLYEQASLFSAQLTFLAATQGSCMVKIGCILLVVDGSYFYYLLITLPSLYCCFATLRWPYYIFIFLLNIFIFLLNIIGASFASPRM